MEANKKDIKNQMASLRFYDLHNNCPTNAGILILGINPLFFFPGAYVQYVKVNGTEVTDEVDFEKRFSGAIITELKNIEDFIKNNIIKEKPVKAGSFQEEVVVNYSHWAMRELAINAIMHRDYSSNAPVYIYEFTDRIEIVNPRGLYGNVNASNFPDASDYRNVVIAEAMKNLGFVNRFNFGVKRAEAELIKNGNGKPEFDISLILKFKVSIPINTKWAI